jgi:high-affinity Fe2+/Pb2+ permease
MPPAGETESERIARNWDEILQELRVTQTGTQILLGFLLTIPFQAGFGELDGAQTEVYLTLVIVAAVATVLALAPVALHRALFRRGAKPQLVRAAHILLRLALAAIALALSGTVFLIFDVVIDHAAALIAGGATLALTVALWVVLPTALRGPPE